MDLATHIYCGEHHRYFNEAQSLHEETSNAEEVSARIRSLYEAGVPIYNKELLRNIAQQLKDKLPKVSVIGIDGTEVTSDIDTGQPYDVGDPETDFIVYVVTKT
jgi:hypothetical protein